MDFPAIWRPKFHKFFLRCPADSANSTETQSWVKTAVEKSAWIKACKAKQTSSQKQSSQLVFNCSKLTIEALKESVKFV